MNPFLDPKLVSLVPYQPGEQPKLQGIIKLNTNESPFPPSPAVIEAVREEAGRLHRYPDPSCGVYKAALSQRLGVEENQLLPANGSDEALAWIFAAYGWQGVAFADITYGFYPVYAKRWGIEPKILPLREDFSIDLQAYYGLQGAVFLANPNAPTGIAVSAASIEKLLTDNPQFLLVVDEAYVDFGAESCLALIKKFDNLLVVGTLSKSRALAGARLGWAAGNEALIQPLQTLRGSFNPYNVSRLSLVAGKAALEDQAYFNQCRQAIINTRTLFAAQLQKMGFVATQSKANYVFVQHPLWKGEKLQAALRRRNILVRRFDVPRIQDWLRITIGTQREMNLCIEAFETIFSE